MAAAKGEKKETEVGLAELMMHATETDCWVVYKGVVYDVTKFADEHPGGAEVITTLAGQDMTVPFDDIEHSDEAKEILEEYRVGKLDGEAAPLKPPKEIGSVGSSTIAPILTIAIVAGIAYYLKNF